MRIAFLVDGSSSTAATSDIRSDAAQLIRRGHRVEIVDGTQLAAEAADGWLGAADVVVVTSARCAPALPSGRKIAIAQWPIGDGPPFLAKTPVLCTTRPGEMTAAQASDLGLHPVRWAFDEAFVGSGPSHRPGRRAAQRIGTTPDGADALRTALTSLGERGLPVELSVVDEREPATPTERVAALRALDAFFLEPRDDTPATTLIEAMACGLPCIVADQTEFPARITGRTDAALCVDPDDPDLLAEAIALVLTHAELRGGLVRAGREVAMRFEPSERAEDLERALAMVFARRGTHTTDEIPMNLIVRGPDRDLARELELRADLHVREGLTDEAIACLDAVLALEPRSILTLIRLGELHLNAGAPDLAIQAFDRAIDAGASSYRVHDSRARALRLARRPNDAARALEAAVLCDDVTAATFRVLADTLRAGGNLEGAQIASREAAVRAAIG